MTEYIRNTLVFLLRYAFKIVGHMFQRLNLIHTKFRIDSLQITTGIQILIGIKRFVSPCT